MEVKFKKYAPSPWHIEGNGGIDIQSDQNDSVAYIATATHKGIKSQIEIDANAKLIALAPELFESLYDLLTERYFFGGCADSSPAWYHARTVMRKIVDV